MARALVMAALLGACSFKPSAAGIDATGGDDDASFSEASVDANPLCPGTGLDLPTVCMAAFPTDDVQLPSDVLDTDTSELCDTAIAKYCVVEGMTISLAGFSQMNVGGSRPLVLMATTSIEIGTTSVIDVSTKQGVDPMTDFGPGADGPECVAGTNPTKANGGGGGQGGSFGGKGGDGGDAFNGANTHGVASALLRPLALQGGCPGATGANTGDPPGHGGGALYMIAPAITIESSVVIDASGGSGFGAQNNDAGGGGGGSGGLVGFDTPHLMLDATAFVFANGGGGGEGSGGQSGLDGTDPTLPTAGGVGGKGGSTGGDGGNGGYAAIGAKPGQNGQMGGFTGGGGGGGGVGWILVFRSQLPAASVNVSPAAQR